MTTRDELVTAGFLVEPATYARLARFVELLLRENQRLNLTAIRDTDEVWRLHVCESLALLPLIRELRPTVIHARNWGGWIWAPGVGFPAFRWLAFAMIWK